MAGNGIIQYVLFPATLIYPNSGLTVIAEGGKIYLEWLVTDVDNDITSYDIYLDLVNGKTTKIAENHTSNKLENISIETNSVYYWQIVAKDSQGNDSLSEIYSFKTQ